MDKREVQREVPGECRNIGESGERWRQAQKHLGVAMRHLEKLPDTGKLRSVLKDVLGEAESNLEICWEILKEEDRIDEEAELEAIRAALRPLVISEISESDLREKVGRDREREARRS